MKPPEVMTGVLSGCVLIALGLVPGLFRNLVEGVRNLCDSVSSGAPVSPPRQTEGDTLQRPIWLAGIGALLITLTVLTYLSSD